jgi:hypothetical protein
MSRLEDFSHNSLDRGDESWFRPYHAGGWSQPVESHGYLALLNANRG